MNPLPKLRLFEQIMLPHLDAAYNLARWLTRNQHDAEDVVQEAYLRAFRFFDSFNGGDGKAWLLAVVRNTSLTRRERERDDLKVPFDEALHGARETGPLETELAQTGAAAGLEDCLASLPPEYREILVLRELEEMPYKEIAYTANLPIGTVMSRLARARRRLADCMIRKTKGAAAP